MTVPQSRVRAANNAPLREERDFVLYWMTATRRTRWSFALDRAVEHAQALGKPLVILEGLRIGYRWASARLHRFVLDGMADNAAALKDSPVYYYPYVEPVDGAGRGLLGALAERAALVVTDDFPSFFLPRMVAAAAEQLDVRLEAIDGNGLLPLSVSGRTFPTAYVFRRFLQKTLPSHPAMPSEDPLAGLSLPRSVDLEAIQRRWPPADPRLLAGDDERLRALPIDQRVRPAPLRGGPRTGERSLARFVDERLERYGESRHLPDAQADSQLSPFLHFGHLSVHEVVSRVFAHERKPFEVEPKPATGKRDGFWGLSPSAEAFLDEAVTWRELGYHAGAHEPAFGTYEAVPGWARQSLARHASDPRPHRYTLDELAAGTTDDEVWNAAQGQLLEEGRIHNAVRMVWGKKLLEWTEGPEEAFAFLVELNNRYALDGRNPNSYSGISWCLGKFDRPWGPERPMFGVVRYMTTASAKRKYKLKGYIERYRPGLFNAR